MGNLCRIAFLFEVLVGMALANKKKNGLLLSEELEKKAMKITDVLLTELVSIFCL